MATTEQKTRPDRATYLPQEAQLLRKRIAYLYNENICLFREARKEQGKIGFAGADDIVLQFESYADGIAGYASFASLRVPKPYPNEAAENLREWSPYRSPVVCEWFSGAGEGAPKTKLYFETLDHMRSLTIEYIEKYNHLTTDQKSF